MTVFNVRNCGASSQSPPGLLLAVKLLELEVGLFKLTTTLVVQFSWCYVKTLVLEYVLGLFALDYYRLCY